MPWGFWLPESRRRGWWHPLCPLHLLFFFCLLWLVFNGLWPTMISHSTHPRLILSSSNVPLLAYDNILSQVTLIKKTMALLNTLSFMVCHMQAPWFTHLKQISYLPYSRAVALEKKIISHLHFYPSLSTEFLSFFFTLKSYISYPGTPIPFPSGNIQTTPND